MAEERKKLMRVALHLVADDITGVLGMLGEILISGTCMGLEIVEAQDDEIISVFKPHVPEAQEEQNEVFAVGEKVVYTDPKNGNELYVTVKHKQGDLVAIEVFGESLIMVDPKFLRHA